MHYTSRKICGQWLPLDKRGKTGRSRPVLPREWVVAIVPILTPQKVAGPATTKTAKVVCVTDGLTNGVSIARESV